MKAFKECVVIQWQSSVLGHQEPSPSFHNYNPVGEQLRQCLLQGQS